MRGCCGSLRVIAYVRYVSAAKGRNEAQKGAMVLRDKCAVVANFCVFFGGVESRKPQA
jgi:hypothetical protein